MEDFNVYKDIQARTNGEIYIGVVGPVRTGKSTFIKRFMDQMVLPYMTDEHSKQRTRDELPQSAAGKTIMTTEPKFIPKEAAEIDLFDGCSVKIRLIDCVGYMVEGAAGHIENNEERKVKTPWYDYDIPFTQAAELGTKKVINNHSTIGLVITTDGSIGDLPREAYLEAEEKTIHELKNLNKPFLVLVNTQMPYKDEAKAVANEIAEKYGVTSMAVNCEQLRKDDVKNIMEKVLYEFPISRIEFYMPKWVEMLPGSHKMKADLIDHAKDLMKEMSYIKDVIGRDFTFESPYVKRVKADQINMSDGCVKLQMQVDDGYYYEILSDLTGSEIQGEYQLLSMLKELSKMKNEYVKVMDALGDVRRKGYGVIYPAKDEILLSNPEVIKNGNKYGVKIKAESPSIHMIRANIETEIAPIVGSEDQANDLMVYIKDEAKGEEGIWGTNIFGKSVEQLVQSGIQSKIAMIGEESQEKLQETMQKIVNDSKGGLICIII